MRLDHCTIFPEFHLGPICLYNHYRKSSDSSDETTELRHHFEFNNFVPLKQNLEEDHHLDRYSALGVYSETMGGGDLNMKKSWHPLLLKNQERVWQEENKAREERKRIEQKRKEIAEERQLQELQRLQESQGGKPRVERLDWMYTAPGTGAHGVSEQMEQYLLGKRGVEELIKGDENEKLKRGLIRGLLLFRMRIQW